MLFRSDVEIIEQTDLAIELSIPGDANLDTKTNAEDLVAIKRSMLSVKTLSPKAFELADLNKDTYVDTVDLVIMKKSIPG